MADRETIDAGAPDSEIDVTPEMAFAGSLELSRADRRIESMEEILVRVFRAMWAAKSASSVGSCHKRREQHKTI